MVNAVNPWVFFGLIVGAMLPYAFSALTMKSVGMVRVVYESFYIIGAIRLLMRWLLSALLR